MDLTSGVHFIPTSKKIQINLKWAVIMFTLYQFPISHYCEKIRWALDYKNIEYQEKNLLPGLHMLTTKRLAPDTSLPILVNDEKIIQGSDRIITYLDENYPEKSLTPEDGKLKAEVLEWENYADQQIGIPLRRAYYHVLLEYPEIIIPLYTQRGPWYGTVLLKAVFPLLKKRMRDGMDINTKTAKESKKQLTASTERIYNHLQDRPFLVGNRFTRADLAAASLLAPLYRLDPYGLKWPDRFPEALEELIEELREKTEWVVGLYDRYR